MTAPDVLVDEDGDEYVWTTKTGRRIPLSQLSDQHLANIIAMLDRQESVVWRVGCMFDSELADQQTDIAIANLDARLDILRAEQQRRSAA